MKSRLLKLSILVLSCADITLGQTQLPDALPETVATCTELQLGESSKSSECKNTGAKAITAFVYRDIDNPKLAGWVDIPSPGLQRGQSYKIFEPLKSIIVRIQVDAAIFADGTYVGKSPDPAQNNEDFIEVIFEWRRAQAQAWAEYQRQFASLPIDNKKAIQLFLQSVADVDVSRPKVAHTIEEAGRKVTWKR